MALQDSQKLMVGAMLLSVAMYVSKKKADAGLGDLGLSDEAHESEFKKYIGIAAALSEKSPDTCRKAIVNIEALNESLAIAEAHLSSMENLDARSERYKAFRRRLDLVMSTFLNKGDRFEMKCMRG
jgi:hypothetical protein